LTFFDSLHLNKISILYSFVTYKLQDFTLNTATVSPTLQIRTAAVFVLFFKRGLKGTSLPSCEGSHANDMMFILSFAKIDVGLLVSKRLRFKS
jgi:hypothetical protein